MGEPLTANVTVLEAPPPGDGFRTPMAYTPAADKSPEVSVAESEVALAKTVVRGEPFTVTTEVGTKDPPVTVIEVLALPAAAEVGLTVATPGVGLLTANPTLFEAPPFGCGLMTAICSVPACARSDATSEAVSKVVFSYEVKRASPFTVTTAREAKFVPLTVRSRLAAPTEVPEGESELICGTGLEAALIVNVSSVVVPPPGCGVVTSTMVSPAFAISVERIWAVRLVVLLKIVVRGEPFHKTLEAGVKFLPVTVKSKPGWPATMLEGLSPTIVGVG